MKRTFLMWLSATTMAVMLLMGMPAMAQSSEPIFTYVEELPEYKGGQEKMWNFLYSNIQYPQECLKDTIEGKVVVSFVVEKDGKLSAIEVSQSSGNELLDAEALRVVGLMGKWKAGKLRGKAVRVGQSLPIQFKMKH